MKKSLPLPKYFLVTKMIYGTRKLVRHYNRVVAPLGLTASQMIALGVLWQEEGISLGEFARRARMGKPAAISMIRRLESLGFVTKEPHPYDARLNVLRLTQKTRKMVPKITSEVVKLESAMEAAFGTSNLKNLVEQLSVIIDMDL